ncbi:MAG TPA: hypothetical protein VFX96_20150, partial [Pyrinomonadaceae bacterium]|nr:hypothetical protein [Pyrinomonadaceae bacterium]
MNYFNYYTEIEDTFIRRRGKHLLLSPMDWALIESWKSTGVPLHVALRGIERAFDSHDARPRRRTVKSLMYCQEEVEAQYAEWLGGQRGAAGEAAEAAASNGGGEARGEESTPATPALPFPREVIAGHLSAGRAEVERASADAGGELREALARASARLEELERDFASSARPDAERLEDALTGLEQMLDRAARATVSPERLEAARASAEEQLRAYRTRMERVTYEQTLDNLVAKQLREEFRVPRLSLFYL